VRIYDGREGEANHHADSAEAIFESNRIHMELKWKMG